MRLKPVYSASYLDSEKVVDCRRHLRLVDTVSPNGEPDVFELGAVLPRKLLIYSGLFIGVEIFGIILEKNKIREGRLHGNTNVQG